MLLFSLLRRRSVALIWSGLAFSALGDQLYAVALGWVAVDVFGAAAGYIAAVKAAIILLTLVIGGGLADRWDRKRTMMGADLLRFASLLLLVLAWSVENRPNPWLLATAVGVLAAGEAFFQPALQALLPGLLAREPGLLVAANSLLDATNRLARLLGPGLIALVGALVAPVHFFSLNAVSFLLSTLALASLRVPPGQPRSSDSGDLHPIASMARGFRVMRRDRLLGYLLDVSGLISGAWYVVFFLAVPLAITQYLGASDASGFGVYGLVISAYGLSNLAANLIIGSRDLPARPSRLIFFGVSVTGLGIVAMAIACSPLVPGPFRLLAFVAASALSGFGGPLKDIPFATLRQTLIAPSDIAAGMRAYLATTQIGMLAAMLTAPWACEAIGPRGVMLVCGAILLGIAGMGWWRCGAALAGRAAVADKY